MKKVIFIVILAMLFGCTIVEIDDYAIVAGMGLDKISDGYELTLEIVDEDGDTLKDYGTSYSVQGDSIMNCIDEFSAVIPKKLFLSHCSVIVIGHELASESIVDVLNYILSETSLRVMVSMVVCKDTTAKEVLNFQSKKYRVISFGVNDSLEVYSKKTGNVEKKYFYHLMNETLNDNITTILPCITMNEEIIFEGGALLNKRKVIGFIDEDILNYYKIIINNLNEGTLELSTYFSPSIKKSNTKIEVDDNQLNITVEITGMIYGSEKDDKIYSNNIQNDFKNELNQILKDKILHNINYFQNLNIDPYKLSDFIYRRNPNLYKKIQDNYIEYFKNLEINIKVNFIIEETNKVIK